MTEGGSGGGTGAAVVAVLTALIVTLAAGAPAVSAQPCATNILCDSEEDPLRDDTVAPESFGTGVTAVNTDDELRIQFVIGPTVIAENAIPGDYAYFGLSLEHNPETRCQPGDEEAEGHVTFANIQNTSPSALFAGISPGGFGPWPVTLRSDHCEEDPGKVRVTNVHLLFPGLGNTVLEGEFTGTNVQPNVNTCEAGGLELDINQPNLIVAGIATLRIDNGSNEPALLCFVSANNYILPEEAPNWKPLLGTIWKD